MILNNESLKSTYFTHGFHPYPAKFTPQMVGMFLSKYAKKGQAVLDPFCGSGTTLVECSLNGIHSVGIDLNPIAALISRAKTHVYTEQDISVAKSFLEGLTNHSLFNEPSVSYLSQMRIPEFPNRDHWFQKNVLLELSELKSKIDQIRGACVSDLLNCAFSKIIVKVSNQDSEVRYTAKQKNHKDGVVFNLFSTTLQNYLDILINSDYKLYASVRVVNQDVMEALKREDSNSYDFIITSPPYINTFDYYLYHKLRMFWLGFDHRIIRKQEIGNHHRIDTKTFEAAKKEYVESMKEIFLELSRVAKFNSRFIIIIGDGIVDGCTIDMSIVVREICKGLSLEIENVQSTDLSKITRSFNRKFSNAPKREHIITIINTK